MIASKLKLIILFVGVIAILFCAWAKPLDTFAIKQVDEGFKRAAISFGTARLIGAVISVAQGTDVSVQPLGIGLKFAPGEILHSVAAGQGRVIERVRPPPRKAGQPPGSKSLEVGW